jgi:RNA polymerase-binding transcription factor DksA
MTTTHTLASPFSESQIAGWRLRLLADRAKALSDCRDAKMESQSADLSQSDDGGEHAQMQEVAHACGQTAVGIVHQIDEALRRIDIADPVPFGICELCLKPIEQERLHLLPWTAWCSSSARNGDG